LDQIEKFQTKGGAVGKLKVVFDYLKSSSEKSKIAPKFKLPIHASLVHFNEGTYLDIAYMELMALPERKAKLKEAETRTRINPADLIAQRLDKEMKEKIVDDLDDDLDDDINNDINEIIKDPIKPIKSIKEPKQKPVKEKPVKVPKPVKEKPPKEPKPKQPRQPKQPKQPKAETFNPPPPPPQMQRQQTQQQQARYVFKFN